MNFNTYLADIGESECSKERRDELYREFIKLSKNTSQKAIRLRIKRFELRVPLDFYEKAKNDADRLRISVQKLIFKLVESIYDNRVFVYISFDLAKKIRWEINKIGTNINMTSRAIQTRKHNEVYRSDIEVIKKDFLRLENYYLSYCTPIDFESLLRREHAKNGEFLNHIEIMISAIRLENSNL